MKLIRIDPLIEKGEFSTSEDWKLIQQEIANSISQVVWPPGSHEFTLYPESGKKRGQGNGVKPIKEACQIALRDTYGWRLEVPVKIGAGKGPGKIDAIRDTPWGIFAFEWETGNISSSHRSLNKMALGICEGILSGGVLVVPSRAMYKYLTDRVGNVQELEPYYPFWRRTVQTAGVLAIFVVEHDSTSTDVPRITKGTDGRALL